MQKTISKIGFNGIFILIGIILVALTLDTSIVKLSAFTGGLTSSLPNIVFFSGIALIFGVGQHFILRFVKRTNEETSLHERIRLAAIHKSVSIIQFVLISIFGFLILQMVFTSSYSTVFLEAVIWINYGLAISLLAFLSYRFFCWFSSNRNAVVLAYALAIITICVNAVFSLIYVTNSLTGEPVIIYPEISPMANLASVYDIFNSAYFLTSIISFVLMWVATVLLLRSYSKKIGRAKYWILVSIPLLYFLSQFQSLFFDTFTSIRLSEPIFFGIVYTLVFSSIIPAGGILFGLAFWSVARSIKHKSVQRYAMISAYGMMLIFSSNQAFGLVLVPYPPFGLVTVSFFGLTSYLIFIGIYSSAISVAEDSDLRSSIRKSAEEQIAMLREIGTSEMENELKNRITILTRNLVDKSEQINEQTGIQSSLEEEEIKEYLEQVVEEIKKNKDPNREANL